MLKNDAIHNSSFRLQDINLDNINDIYFAINIIVIITTTLFKALIALFILKLIIVIIINVDIIIIIIIAFKKFILKLIAFDLNIKSRFIMSVSFDKSQNLTIVEIYNSVFLRIDDDISLFWEKSNKAIKKTLSEKGIIELFTFREKIITILINYRIIYFNEKADSILISFINLWSWI